MPNVILTEKERNFDEGIRLQANTSELVVSTSLKKLTAYVFAVTQKSPKKFRGTLVKYLQDKCIEAIENVIKANSTKRTTKESIEQRKNFQQNAYANLKIISYLSFVSTGFACLTKKQYEQIATMVADSLNLLVAWRKSDAGNVPFLSANKDETQ